MDSLLTVSLLPKEHLPCYYVRLEKVTRLRWASLPCAVFLLTIQVMLSVQMALSIAIHGLQELAHVEEEEVYTQNRNSVRGG